MTTAWQIKPQGETSQKRPPVKDGPHKEFVSQLSCVISLRRPVEVAHVRFADARFNKPETGMQAKPDDKWCVPMTRYYHQDADDAQHKGNEREFWQTHNINVLKVCQALYAVTGDIEAGEDIIRRARSGEYPHRP